MTRTSSSTSNQPLRLAGYVRVSRVAGRAGDAFISPDVQRQTIEAHARAHGHEVVSWHEDLDVSGGKAAADRPGLSAILGAIHAREVDGIAVAKLDRLSRQGVGEALKLVEVIQEGGGSVVAVDLGLDPTTMTGELVMTVLLALARMERRRLSESWETAKTRAHERGAKIGPTPLGYLRQEDGTLAPHPERAPIVREAFRLAAEQGLGAALEYLDGLDLEHEHGKRAGRRLSWTTSTVRRMLANRTYLGEVRYGDLPPVREDALQLVLRSTWEAAQHEQGQRRRPARHYPLSGLARCASCGEAMVGGSAGANRRTYRCRASLKAWKGQRCPAPVNVLADSLEEYVRAQLVEALAAHPGYIGEDDTAGDLAAAELELREAEADRAAFLSTAAALVRTLGAEHVEAEAAKLAERVDAAQLTFRQAAREHEGQTRHVPAADLVAGAELEDLAPLLAGALENVTVTRGRGRLHERVTLTPRLLRHRAVDQPVADPPDVR